ncbi:telomere repeats-binding bouquet formation protein 2 [Aulostomus maculatus]
MFTSKTAWFSSSVPPARHNFWISEGGSLAKRRRADYLFSDDATCPDTLRVFESKDYLWNKVMIFHSLFLSACEKRRSVTSLCIGHYVLPPTPVQDVVRNVVKRFIWEHEDERPSAQASHKSSSYHTEDEDSEEESSGCNSPEDFNTSTSGDEDLQDYPASNVLPGYVSMCSLQKYSGDLCDFQPRCSQCCNSGARFHLSNPSPDAS